MNKSVKLVCTSVGTGSHNTVHSFNFRQSVSNLMLKARGKINMQNRKKITLDITNTSQADQNKLIIN